MSLKLKLTNAFLWFLLSVLCKIDLKELKKVPQQGPFILAMNHINFLEVPMIQLALRPRMVQGIVKKETLDKRFLRYLCGLWNAIPLDREGNPEKAFELAGEVFRNKGILIIAPEGTRSGDGKLQEAHGGIVLLAHRYKVPVLPVAHFGGDAFWSNFKRFRRTPFTFRVGEMIHLEVGQSLKKSIRKRELNRIMSEMARILPEENRGFYSDCIGKA